MLKNFFLILIVFLLIFANKNIISAQNTVSAAVQSSSTASKNTIKLSNESYEKGTTILSGLEGEDITNIKVKVEGIDCAANDINIIFAIYILKF